MKKGYAFIIFVFCCSIVAHAQSRIPSIEAQKHVGERVTVTGKIVGAKVVSASRSRQTILYMGSAFPNQHLALVIQQDDRKYFPYKPEEFLLNKRVSVTGKLVDTEGRTEMVLNDAGDVKAEGPGEEPGIKPMDVGTFSRFFEED